DRVCKPLRWARSKRQNSGRERPFCTVVKPSGCAEITNSHFRRQSDICQPR
ncbi:hypothetical protein AZZ62_004979, partial [Klebsiella variicola]